MATAESEPAGDHKGSIMHAHLSSFEVLTGNGIGKKCMGRDAKHVKEIYILGHEAVMDGC
jgi:hypothetical protein